MTDITLYNYFRSSTSYRVRIVLHYKQIEFSYKPVHLLKNEQRSKDYLQVNPLGGVPALFHNSHYISESMAICEYLEEVFPEHPLLPKDSFMRAKIRQFCEIINSFMHPMGNLKTLKQLETQHSYSQEEKDAWVQYWIHQGLEALEEVIKDYAGNYCFGDQVTFAEAFLIPQLFTAKRFNVDISQYTLLSKINDNCLKLQAFHLSHPLRQIDTPEDLKIP